MDDVDNLFALTQCIVSSAFAVAGGSTIVDEEDEATLYDTLKLEYDHRLNPRKKRRKFDHYGAQCCILRDYLGPKPLFNGREFEMMFRVSKSRFQAIYDDIRKTGNKFFFPPNGRGASTEARLLLPLKTLAYGVPPHTFTDYFQMSKTQAGNCCEEFDKAINSIYIQEYLRKPTVNDLKAIEKLHFEQHGVRGLYGSLDCMHSWWKNCPKAWQQTFKGKEWKPTIILEAVCDYNLWFWNIFYGSGGSFNDLNVLALSNLTTSFFLPKTISSLSKQV